MQADFYYQNYTMIITFVGTVKDFDGTLCPCEWKVPTNPQETVRDLISKFYKISYLDPSKYKLYFNGQILGKDSANSVAQQGLTNNAKIEIFLASSKIAEESSNILISKVYQDRENICKKHIIRNYIEEVMISDGTIDTNKSNNINDCPIEHNNLCMNRQITPNKKEYENKYNYKIYIKFIKYGQNSIFNCNTELKGILKLCLLNEIASKIDDSSLDYIRRINKSYDIIYIILKILKNSNFLTDTNYKADEAIKKVMEKETGRNIINFSNCVDDNIDNNFVQWLMNFIKGQNLQEINDVKFRLGKYNTFIDYFEKDLNKCLRNSIFEFSVVSLVILDRQDFDKFEREREKCPNREDRILYHGTQIHPISCILTGLFRKSENCCFQHGKGVYFTDFLDYCWFYGGKENNRGNKNKIPKIGDTFTAIANMVYYDKSKFLKVKDYKTRIQPGKNEINFAYAGSEFETMDGQPDYRKFVGTEYVIWDLDQICPFISIKFKRE